jgi:hypothetical protein
VVAFSLQERLDIEQNSANVLSQLKLEQIDEAPEEEKESDSQSENQV